MAIIEESPKYYERDWYFSKVKRLMENGGALDKLTERRYAQSRSPENERVPLKDMPEAQECLELLQEIKKQDISRGARTFDNVEDFLSPEQDESAPFFHIWTFRDIFTSETRGFGEKEAHIGKMSRHLVIERLEMSEKRNIEFYFFDVCHEIVSMFYKKYADLERKRSKA